jgi:hypothetical protein
VGEQELNEVLVPYSGEIVNLADPPGCLKLLSEIRDLESQLRDVKGALTAALAEEFSRQGMKTIEMNGVKAVLGPDTEIVWDVEVLQTLAELGLPEERLNALVTPEVTYKVNAAVAKQIAAANPSYAEVIERAKSRVPRTPYVSIKRG